MTVSRYTQRLVWVLFFIIFTSLSLNVIADEGDSTNNFRHQKPPTDGYVPDEDNRFERKENGEEIKGLQQEIQAREDKILKTEKEIENINTELNQIYKKKRTLEGDLKELTLTSKRNEAQIHITEDTISQGQLRLKSLNSSIEDNTENLKMLRTVLTKNYRQAAEFESRGVDVSILLVSSLFDMLRKVEEVGRYSKVLNKHLQILQSEVRSLERNKDEVIKEKDKLQQEQKELEDRKKIYQFSISNKAALVRKTKNDEKSYQKLLKEKQAERSELLQEVYEYESRIEYLRDPKSVPKPKKGLLRVPFDIPIRVTQRFGSTEFARANAYKYGKPFHDGMDFGIPSGTRLKASADGVIVGAGNTDLVPTCHSWGKWVLIKHPFGLSTLYAHLSLIKVRVGQKVNTGDLIGYSGNTGFSTGPHLHFGVYDSNGIKVVPYEQISSGRRCRGLLVPTAAQDAKFDPGKYLAL